MCMSLVMNPIWFQIHRETFPRLFDKQAFPVDTKTRTFRKAGSFLGTYAGIFSMALLFFLRGRTSSNAMSFRRGLGLSRFSLHCRSRRSEKDSPYAHHPPFAGFGRSEIVLTLPLFLFPPHEPPLAVGWFDDVENLRNMGTKERVMHIEC